MSRIYWRPPVIAKNPQCHLVLLFHFDFFSSFFFLPGLDDLFLHVLEHWARCSAVLFFESISLGCECIRLRQSSLCPVLPIHLKKKIDLFSSSALTTLFCLVLGVESIISGFLPSFFLLYLDFHRLVIVVCVLMRAADVSLGPRTVDCVSDSPVQFFTDFFCLFHFAGCLTRVGLVFVEFFCFGGNFAPSSSRRRRSVGRFSASSSARPMQFIRAH